jgi:O-antigen biosynthesis protein
MELSHTPLISCLCPTKNRRRFLDESVRRFLAQDYPAKELLIVEDGTEAETREAARQLDRLLAQSDSIRYYKFRGSLGAKLNYAAELAGGDILANWDDDDWYAPGRLSAQFAHMRATGKAFVGLSAMLFYREGDSEGWEYTGYASYAGGATHFYRRDWILAHPRPDVTLAEDVAAIADAYEAGQLSTISGLDIMVARDHDRNTCQRPGGTDRGWHQIGDLKARSDNWRPVPLSRIHAVINR